MRLSSIVALLVVTASLALGGCAADAESSSKDENVTHAGALETDNGFAKPFVDGRIAVDNPSFVEENGRARAIETAAFGHAPRFDERKPVIGGRQVPQRLDERPLGLGLAPQGEGNREPFAEPADPQLGNAVFGMSPEEMAAVVDQHTGASTKP